MNKHITEVERCDAIEAVHWKEKWMEAQRRLDDLQGQINRYALAVREYEDARRGFKNERRRQDGL